MKYSLRRAGALKCWYFHTWNHRRTAMTEGWMPQRGPDASYIDPVIQLITDDAVALLTAEAILPFSLRILHPALSQDFEPQVCRM